MMPENLQKIMHRISYLNKQFSSLVSRSNQVENPSEPQTLNVNTNSRNETFRTVLNSALNNPEENSYMQRTGNAFNRTAILPAIPSHGINSPYDSIIQQAAQKYAVPPALIRAIIKVESDFNPNAVSRAGARGLMQIMPAHDAAQGITNVFDPQQNIFAGTRIFRDFYNLFNQDLEKALAAYNAGPNRVSREGIPAHVRRNYVNRVLNYFRQYGG